MNGLFCYPEQRACVSREKMVYGYYIPETSLTSLRTHGIGLNGQTRTNVLSGWLCITQSLKHPEQTGARSTRHHQQPRHTP